MVRFVFGRWLSVIVCLNKQYVYLSPHTFSAKREMSLMLIHYLLQAHRPKFGEAVHSVAYHPSRNFIATGGADSIIKIYQ